MSKFELHPEAYEDLDRIAAYIARDSVDHVIAEMFRTFSALAAFPHQGHRRSDLTTLPLRFSTVYSYLIAYAPDEDPLWIIAVIHGRRDPRAGAAILRSRDPEGGL